jgi:hypothetical protein
MKDKDSISITLTTDEDNLYCGDGATVGYTGDGATVGSTYAPTYTVAVDTSYTDMNDTGSEFSINFDPFQDNSIDLDRVERMTKYYPALENVYKKFKHIYDMCNQDYKGKYEDGDIPF